MNPVSIVVIREKQTLYKGDNPAERIELIKLEETDFDIVSQKDLYQVGDKAIYIQPDFCLSDIPLFDGFIRPGGDESKSMLGKVGGQARRIRAKKFNFSKEPNGDVVYSNGILLPYNEVETYISALMSRDIMDISNVDLTDMLDITKYEEPETASKGGLNVNGCRSFPDCIYKTDEDNYFNVSNKLQFPIKLIGTEKIDGCLDENTLINTNMGNLSIKDICNNSYKNIEILSYNIKTGIKEFKKLLNTKITKNKNNWFKILLEDDTELIVTSNHPIFLPKLNCYRKVESLTTDDFVGLNN